MNTKRRNRKCSSRCLSLDMGLACGCTLPLLNEVKMGLEDLKDELHSLLLQRELVDFDIASLKCNRKDLSIAIKEVQKRIKRELRIQNKKHF